MWVSMLESASSRIKMRGSRKMARASAVRCFWPPERLTPRSPTTVSSPRGSCSRSLLSRAVVRASSTSASLAESTPYITFSRSVSENRNVSCGTYPTERRKVSSGNRRMSTPSIKTWPSSASRIRGTRLMRVVLPAPVIPTMATVEPASTVKETLLKTERSP